MRTRPQLGIMPPGASLERLWSLCGLYARGCEVSLGVSPGASLGVSLAVSLEQRHERKGCGLYTRGCEDKYVLAPWVPRGQAL